MSTHLGVPSLRPLRGFLWGHFACHTCWCCLWGFDLVDEPYFCPCQISQILLCYFVLLHFYGFFVGSFKFEKDDRDASSCWFFSSFSLTRGKLLTCSSVWLLIASLIFSEYVAAAFPMSSATTAYCLCRNFEIVPLLCEPGTCLKPAMTFALSTFFLLGALPSHNKGRTLLRRRGLFSFAAAFGLPFLLWKYTQNSEQASLYHFPGSRPGTVFPRLLGDIWLSALNLQVPSSLVSCVVRIRASRTKGDGFLTLVYSWYLLLGLYIAHCFSEPGKRFLCWKLPGMLRTKICGTVHWLPVHLVLLRKLFRSVSQWLSSAASCLAMLKLS